MASDMGLLVVMILLSITMLVALVLIFACYTRLHESLMVSTIHHHMLTLLMALVVHSKMVVRRSLGHWRARRGWGVISIIVSAAVYWRSVARQMPLGVLVVLIVLLIVWTSPMLLETSVSTICHLIDEWKDRRRRFRLPLI